jgi:Ca-activated chloride channel family protein
LKLDEGRFGVACMTAALLCSASVEKTWAQAGLLVPTSTGRADAEVLSLREMAVDVGISRGYARVNVRQVFENRTDQTQEGTYRFALPASAAVGDFAVWDGLVRIPGVILEKQRARAIYRQLATQRVDPGLLQQGEEEDRTPGTGPAASRPSSGALFSVRVAPIPARATKRLELQFQQDVPFARGAGEFRLGLRPPDGEPPTAGRLDVHVRLDEGDLVPSPESIPLTTDGRDLTFSGTGARLDRDLVVRIAPSRIPPLQVSAFRNPEGRLPDGLALAPWERPSEIPPEKDGFFLLQAFPPGPRATSEGPAASVAARPPVSLAILFDTSLSHRWSGLEVSYARLVRALDSLRPDDRFVVVPFDREPAEGLSLHAATRDAVQAALSQLRERPLAPGTNVPKAVTEARRLAGERGRILLLADGYGAGSSRALAEARGALPLFAAITGESGEALANAAAATLGPGATDVEADLFFVRVLAPLETPELPGSRAATASPFTVSGGDPRLRDVYPTMIQPMAAASLSGWVGRYAVPRAGLHWTVKSPLFEGGSATADGPLPERALDARDLPRRWARARVDDLLRRIEAEGEKREWIEEIIALSKRYKFVTPYTAFLAAPRSLLRPRRIQPGDPVLRVECDPGIVAAVAYFPFGLRLPLARRSGSTLWEGRFLVPEGLADGRYAVRIVLRDMSGARISESKSFVLDGRAPVITPDPLPPARAGETVRISVRTDEDVILLSARVGDAPPVPLRWDGASKRSTGLLRVPAGLFGAQPVFLEAVDAAKNRGFARVSLEVRP